MIGADETTELWCPLVCLHWIRSNKSNRCKFNISEAAESKQVKQDVILSVMLTSQYEVSYYSLLCLAEDSDKSSSVARYFISLQAVNVNHRHLDNNRLLILPRMQRHF